MKKNFLFGLLAILLAGFWFGGASMATESIVDLNDQEVWIIDREEPNNFSVANGKISFTVKETPAAEAWNAWQGRGAYPNVAFENTWAVEYTLAITSEMLTTNNVNASMWIQVDKNGGNTAVSQTDCVDWSIIQFINNGTPKFQVWKANGGGWTDIDGTDPEVGTYTIKTVFDNGVITQYINGEQVNTYNLEDTTTRPAYIIAQGRSYGASFSVEMGVPTITIPYEKIKPELQSNIGEQNFVAGSNDWVEFTFTTIANEYVGVNVIGGSDFGVQYEDKIAALEYKVGENTWYDMKGQNFGGNGFPLTDATSTFRVKFTADAAGSYTFNAFVQSTADSTNLATLNIPFTVVNPVVNTSSSSGGGGGSSKKTTTKTDTKATTGDTTKVDDKKTEETNTEDNSEVVDGTDANTNTNDTNVNENRYKDSDGDGTFDNGLNKELVDAYVFAHENGITTMNSPEEADMFGPLTRIAMAKMLSQYAINVLGKTPDTTRTISFPDVSAELDAQYDNGVTLAYQLGIMGIGIDKFRPDDLVTRAEFGTALSRMLFGLADGEELYYETHLQKLMDEKIITDNNPDLQKLRGYVMIMLMRSAQ